MQVIEVMTNPGTTVIQYCYKFMVAFSYSQVNSIQYLILTNKAPLNWGESVSLNKAGLLFFTDNSRQVSLFLGSTIKMQPASLEPVGDQRNTLIFIRLFTEKSGNEKKPNTVKISFNLQLRLGGVTLLLEIPQSINLQGDHYPPSPLLSVLYLHDEAEHVTISVEWLSSGRLTIGGLCLKQLTALPQYVSSMPSV